MKIANLIAFILVIAGAINWALIEFFQFNLITLVGGSQQMMRISYAVFGISALWCTRFLARKSFRQALAK